ncbi:hypothetical protein C8F01DRAFT_1255881 [Mycena amicta]|nr:hypothetical protein C8F01DRAFT_1255881 [Mycena amicta]
MNNRPPSPCAENPGRVYPRSDPSKARPPLFERNTPRYVGNPYLMNGAFKKLDHSLGELIAILEGEEASSLLDEENPLLEKFRTWREELDLIRAAGGRSPASTSVLQLATPSRSRSPGRSRSPVRREGGLFVD